MTNKGVGGLLKRWGEGASMVRGTWKPRENSNESESDEGTMHEDNESLDVDDEEVLAAGTVKANTTQLNSEGGPKSTEANVDVLASSMDSLTLVPRSIRFGRGARNIRPTRENQRGSSKSARYD